MLKPKLAPRKGSVVCLIPKLDSLAEPGVAPKLIKKKWFFRTQVRFFWLSISFL